ncbi:MAG: DNA-binding protein WhiA [Ruminococcaceae bacterium]|nr:DNA-binding protein WhiA [Oscillospiraceae bacterium]
MLMTYSQQVKNFLCEKSWEEFKAESNYEKAKFFLYGILLFSGEFGFERIILKCENSNILEVCAYVLINCFDADIKITERKKGDGLCYTISVDKAEDIKKITDNFGYTSEDVSVYRIKKRPDADCRQYFLRGVFVACGNIHSPQKSYHLEFSTSRMTLSGELFSLLEEAGIDIKKTTRRSYYVLYCKGSESIEDFLMLLGAENFAYDVIETRIEKGIINNINRVSNFESANLNKTIDAAAISLSAIAYLREQGVFESLPESLKETAKLREENPELTLSELCKLFKKPISKSGLCHRINKIITTAREYSDYTLF